MYKMALHIQSRNNSLWNKSRSQQKKVSLDDILFVPKFVEITEVNLIWWHLCDKIATDTRMYELFVDKTKLIIKWYIYRFWDNWTAAN